MALNSQYSNVTRNAKATALGTLANSGLLKLYTGTQPATAETALSGNTLLATLTLNATAFGAAALGVITANAITADTNAAATGTATWFRLFKSDGTTVVFDGTVGTATANLIMNSAAIQAGAAVSAASLTYTEPASGT